MQIKQNRGDLTTKQQVAEKTQEMNIGMQRAMAQELTQLGQVEKAVDIYERITKTMPEDFASRAQLATLYTRLNQHDKSSETWTTLLEADPENTKYQDGLVNSLQSAGKLAEAFELTQKYIQAEPEIGVHYVRLAKLYSNENRTDEAIATYEKAMEFAPGNRQIFLNMADLYLRNDNMVEAEKAFKNAIPFTTSSYDRENIERKLINLYRYQGNLDEMFQKAEDAGTLTSGMQRERARSYLNKGELQQSVEAFKKAIDMTTDSYARDRISNELLEVYVQLDDTDSALEIFEKNASSGRRIGQRIPLMRESIPQPVQIAHATL